MSCECHYILWDEKPKRYGIIDIMDGAGYVVACRRIEQSPLSDAPDVPRGTRGYLDDEDCDDILIVDFGARYGHVLCEPEDVR